MDTRLSEMKSVIYLGPDIPRLNLKHGLTLRNGVPDHIMKIYQQVPAIRDLFVPVTQIAASEQLLACKGSYLDLAYQEVVKAAAHLK